MRPVVYPANQKDSFIFEDLDCDAIVAATRDAPALEFTLQRLGHSIRIRWERPRAELDHGRTDFEW